MPQFFWWIIRQIAIDAALTAILTPSPDVSYSPPTPPTETYIEASIPEPDYDDLLSIEPEAYGTSFYFSEEPVRPQDLRGSFTGLYNDKTFSFNVYPDLEESQDTFYFSYRMLNMETLVSTTFNDGVVVASEDKIVLNWKGEPIEGNVYKIDNISNGKTHILFWIQTAGEKFLFYDTQSTRKLIRP